MKKKAETLVKDKKAPKELMVTIKDAKGKQWGTFRAIHRTFDSKATGFNITGRATNPLSGHPYIFSGNLVLIGSKPKAKKKVTKG